MRRLLICAGSAVALTIGSAATAAADPPNAACAGLDVAHEQIHGTGTAAEHRLHELRAANHCGH